MLTMAVEREATVAIIPARGGSKRIPGKNIKPFLGKPILAYSIEKALKSGLFGRVMVSTDDARIAEVAREYGAEVPFFRSSENANDFATTSAVLEEVLEQYEQKLGLTFEQFACIYPTSPLMQIAHLRQGFELLQDPGFDSVYPVVPFGYPIWRGVKREGSGLTRMVWPEYINSRSQDLEKVYHDAGQWYLVKTRPFRESGQILMDRTTTIVLDENEVQDIDNPVDWQMAELKYKMLTAE